MSFLREFRPLLPIVQTLFFSRTTSTEKEQDGTMTAALQRASGFPTTYAQQSFYALRPHFHYGKDGFQTAVKDYSSVDGRTWPTLSEEDRVLVGKVLDHWKLHGDQEANAYTHIILEANKSPKLICKNRDAEYTTGSRCKIIHLPSLDEQLTYLERKHQEETRSKNRFLMISLLGVFLGVSSQLS
jgi:hypothetical protein